jgi:hypothetical protein
MKILVCALLGAVSLSTLGIAAGLMVSMPMPADGNLLQTPVMLFTGAVGLLVGLLVGTFVGFVIQPRTD